MLLREGKTESCNLRMLPGGMNNWHVFGILGMIMCDPCGSLNSSKLRLCRVGEVDQAGPHLA